MKLITKTGEYISPLATQGKFEGAYIEDVEIVHRRKDKFLSVMFALNYYQKGAEFTIAKKLLTFKGLNADDNNTNQTAFVKVLNPDYDSDFVEDEDTTTEEYLHKTSEFFIKPLLEHLAANGGKLNKTDVITDFGYPTYEEVVTYFDGGDFDTPAISLSNPIAQGFVLSKLIINGQAAGVQFKFEE